MLTWRLTDLHCNTVGYFDQRQPGSNVTLLLSGQGRATLNVSLEEDLVHQVKPLETGLYVEYNGDPLFHGPCLDPVFSGSTGTAVIQAVDAGEWAARGFHHELHDRTDEQSEIMWQVIALRLVDFDATTATYLARIVRGEIEATGLVRELKTEAGTNCWQPLLDLNTLESGPEFELVPLPPDVRYDRNDGSGMLTCAAWSRLNVHRRIGLDRTGEIKFQYGFGFDNAQDFIYSPLGSAVKNYENAVGQAQGTDPQPQGFSDNPAERAALGTWEGWDNTSFVTADVCKAYAQQQVAGYAAPVQGFTVVPAQEWMSKVDGSKFGYPPEFLTDYFLGDTISAEGQLGVKRYPTSGRITQVVVTEADAHKNVKVSLTCVPTIESGGFT